MPMRPPRVRKVRRMKMVGFEMRFEDIAAFREIAEREDCSAARLMRQACTQWLDNYRTTKAAVKLQNAMDAAAESVPEPDVARGAADHTIAEQEDPQ